MLEVTRVRPLFRSRRLRLRTRSPTSITARAREERVVQVPSHRRAPARRAACRLPGFSGARAEIIQVSPLLMESAPASSPTATPTPTPANIHDAERSIEPRNRRLPGQRRADSRLVVGPHPRPQKRRGRRRASDDGASRRDRRLAPERSHHRSGQIVLETTRPAQPAAGPQEQTLDASSTPSDRRASSTSAFASRHGSRRA